MGGSDLSKAANYPAVPPRNYPVNAAGYPSQPVKCGNVQGVGEKFNSVSEDCVAKTEKSSKTSEALVGFESKLWQAADAINANLASPGYPVQQDSTS